MRFVGIGVSQFSTIRLGQIKDGKALANVFLGSSNKLGLLVSPVLNENTQPFYGMCADLGVEAGGDLGGYEELAPVYLACR